MKKKSQRYAPGFGRHMQNIGKIAKFFLCPNRLPKVSRNKFIAFFDNSKHSIYVHKNFLKKVQKSPLELKFEFPLSMCYGSGHKSVWWTEEDSRHKSVLPCSEKKKRLLKTPHKSTSLPPIPSNFFLETFYISTKLRKKF